MCRKDAQREHGGLMGATIKDIAKMVGVSPSTVSRVIHGNAPISDEIKAKIKRAMEELDYHPNSGARMLVTGSTYTIALVVDADDENTFANTFFNRSVFAIERVAQKNGYNLLITNDGDGNGKSISSLVYEQKVDGLILPSSSVREGLVELFQKEKIPWVILGEPEEPKQTYSWVDIDNYDGSKKAVTHMLKMGYQKIAYIADDDHTVFSKKRIAGYLDALRECGAENTNPCVISCGMDEHALKEQIRAQLSEQSVDAYLCSNNILAYHAMHEAKRVNCSIPRQVGIAAFDNQPLAEYMDPPLTVVDVDTYRLGEEAGKLLIGMIKGKEEKAKGVLIETELMQRASTDRKGELYE